MDRSEAAAHLGVEADASRDVVRSAFRRSLLRHHPDVAGGDGAATRALTEAYRTLLEPVPSPPDEVVVASATDDTLTLALPPDEAFLRLLDAAAHVGAVTYVDDEAGLLEVVVTFDDGRAASVVVTLQGRGAGTTDAFCTLEPLDGAAGPPVAVVVDALGCHLA